MDKTLAGRRLARLITNFQRCRHKPQRTCKGVAGYCVLHADVNYVHSEVFLTHGDTPLILRRT
jgi:hypothetical protein